MLYYEFKLIFRWAWARMQCWNRLAIPLPILTVVWHRLTGGLVVSNVWPSNPPVSVITQRGHPAVNVCMKPHLCSLGNTCPISYLHLSAWTWNGQPYSSDTSWYAFMSISFKVTWWWTFRTTCSQQTALQQGILGNLRAWLIRCLLTGWLPDLCRPFLFCPITDFKKLQMQRERTTHGAAQFKGEKVIYPFTHLPWN